MIDEVQQKNKRRFAQTLIGFLLPASTTNTRPTPTHDRQQSHTPRPPNCLSNCPLALSCQPCTRSGHDFAHLRHVVCQDSSVLIAIVVQTGLSRFQPVDVNEVLLDGFGLGGAQERAREPVGTLRDRVV